MVNLASKTMLLVNFKMEADQGSLYRQTLRQVLPKMEDAYRGEDSPFRTHLGVSLIGRPCKRELWYSFHWAWTNPHGAQTLRIFNRGHLEEARVLSLLIQAGVAVWFETENGGQYRISYLNGHFGSAADGVVRGLPELPNENVNLEMKTANDKNFAKIAKDGCLAAKPEHYAQQQIEMDFFNLKYSLYVVVNKNDDNIYMELIEYHARTAQIIKEKAQEIIFSSSAPAKINDDPSWWQCRFCDYKKICKQNYFPLANCRTCKFAYPAEDGSWACGAGNQQCISDKKTATQGCFYHVYNPSLISDSCTLTAVNCDHIEFIKPNNVLEKNGPNHTPSHKIACKQII